MSHETYRIPANYTDAGRLFGLFEIRNAIEAAALGLPILFLCARFLPFSLTAKIIVTMTLFIPAAGFALIGINGDSLTGYVKARKLWHGKRKVLAYRGEVS
ncbi:MAG: hypothetical protein LBS24_08070 [Clostridiales Family XIII bacterium]|nr:hypothetical protein [Clostridiales Family XIII bacterium]